MPRALVAVAPRTTELVEYDEPPLGDRDVRIRREFAAPKHGTESHAYLDEEWHLTRVTVRSSMPVRGNPSRDHPLWDDRRVEETALQLMRAGRLQSDCLVHPVAPFEQSAEAYHWIHDTPDRVVKLGIRFPRPGHR